MLQHACWTDCPLQLAAGMAADVGGLQPAADAAVATDSGAGAARHRLCRAAPVEEEGEKFEAPAAGGVQGMAAAAIAAVVLEVGDLGLVQPCQAEDERAGGPNAAVGFLWASRAQEALDAQIAALEVLHGALGGPAKVEQGLATDCCSPEVALGDATSEVRRQGARRSEAGRS